MPRSSNYSPLFRFACKAMKYYLLALVGFTIACSLGAILGAIEIVLAMLATVSPWVLRLAAVNACLIVTAVITESLRH